MAIRTSVKSKGKTAKTKKPKKGGKLVSKVKKAKARKPAMSLDEKRKRVREAVRKLRARQRSKGLTYNHKIHAWVPFKDKKTAAFARRRSGKKSPLFGKPVKNLAGRLAKRARTQAARKKGFNAGGKRRAKALRIGKRPAVKLRKKKTTTARRAGNRTAKQVSKAVATSANRAKAFKAASRGKTGTFHVKLRPKAA